MYKLTIIVAIALGSMAFVQSDKSNRTYNDENHVNNDLLTFASADQGQKGGKGNKGGKVNQGGKGNKGDQGNKGGGKQGGQTKNKSQGAHGKGMIKQHSKSNKPKKNQAKDHGKAVKPHKVNQGSKGKANKSGKNHFDKGHPNFGYVYKNKHGYISHRNYGQWRSQQARNKHKKYHPVYEYEAVEGFNLIISRNVFLFSETSYKMDLLRVRLSDKRKAGTITEVKYDSTIRRIDVLKRRRAQLQINIDL
jgi:hypothetical protein